MGVTLHLNKLESSPKNALNHFNLVEIGPVIFEKKKMWKDYDDDADDNYYGNDNNDDGQRTNWPCDQKSSIEPLAQVS